MFEEGFACNMLAEMYKKGFADEKDIIKAMEFYKKACDSNVGSACSNIALILIQNNNSKVENVEINNLFQKACSLNYGIGCLNLGYRYEIGNEDSINKAKELFKKACEYGETKGCNLFNELNENISN